MAGRDKESQEIMAAAMRFVKSGDRTELETFTLAALKKADYQLGDRDSGSGYRRAIEDLIAERETKSISEREEDVIDAKPNFFGFGVNLNALWRRVKKWRSRNDS
ncbi:MAG: hypothetical protein ABW092_09725 [Candidatus Thiodiazotropha sp.]